LARSIFKTVYVHRSQFKKFLFNSEKRDLREKYYDFLTKKNVKISPYFFFEKEIRLLINDYWIQIFLFIME